MKTPTMTANGVAHQSVSTNGSPLSGAPAVVRTPLPTRQRRVGWTTLGAVLVVGLGLVFGYLYSTAGSKEPVVVVTAPVAVGAVIDRSDLSTVDVAGDITAIAGANLDSVVGQRAAVGLLPGTVLQRSMVTDADPIPAGRAQVGVAVKGGQLPADGLAPGDRVQVLRLPGQVAGAGDPAAPVVLVPAATVFAAHQDPVQPGTTLLTLVVPADVAPPVAAASAAGAVAVVKVGAS